MMAASRAKKRKLTEPMINEEVTDVVTHNDLQVLESRVQSLEKKLLNQAKQTRKILKILEQRHQASRPSPIGGSRTSSVGNRRSSTDQSAPVDDGAEALTEEDKRTHAFDEIIENLLELDGFFQVFLLRSGCRSLVKRSGPIQASAAAFVEAVKDQLGSYLGEAEAQAIIAQISSLDDEEIIDVYIGLSHRHRARGVHGKVVWHQ